MFNCPARNSKVLRARILSASFVLLSGAGLATSINLAYNIAVARYLGPDGFGNATAVYTLLTLISAITLSFQIISAKVVAQQSSIEGKYAGYIGLHRGAWGCGVFVAILLILFKKTIADYLNLPTPVLVVLLAIGVAFYVPLGSRRGYLQGAYGFRRLAINLIIEGAIRLGGSILLIQLGLGVRGVIAANSVAVAVSYFSIVPKVSALVPDSIQLYYAIRETAQAMVFFFGQVIINNCDIVLVKHFFLSETAGLYAAIAMVGRVIFSFSSAIVNSMFPLVAGTGKDARRNISVIATSLLLVLSIGFSLAIGLRFTPPWIWTELFGNKFSMAGKYGLSYMLALYAITTVVYSLSAVIITYEMSYKISSTSWIQLVFSVIVIVGILRFHSSLRQVILVQLWLLSLLLIFVALPFVVNLIFASDDMQEDEAFQSMKVIRRVLECEVIAEFLKSDFENPKFKDYREVLRDVVANPNFDDFAENEKRRALFFIRHLALWNELPPKTEWYEMEVMERNLGQIRVFPRAQWRKIARGNFSITQIVEYIQKNKSSINYRFISKIDEIRNQLLLDHTTFGSVVLIGVSERESLTILDGNHRLVAAMLAYPNRMHRLRFLCGLSPKMSECCWYKTNIITLFRYGKNILRNSVRNPKSELARCLEVAE